MRCLPIRSVFRAALLAGLIGSSQNASVSASWKDCMPPRNGSCFIHDLHWERYQPQPVKSDVLVNSFVQPVEAEAQGADRELKLCLAAAKQFELNQQVEAVQAAIQSNVKQVPTIASKMVASYARSKKIFYTIIENRNLNLAKVALAPETLPVAAVLPEEERAYNYDWNCGDWCQGYSHPMTVSLPSREVANLFIYTLDTPATANHDSIWPVAIAEKAKSEIIDSCSMAYSEYIADNLLTEAEISQWNSAIAAELTHPWQVGVDPVCSEVQSMSVAGLSQSSLATRSVCCPIDDAAEAVSTVANVEIAAIDSAMVALADVAEAATNVSVEDFAARPPILEAEIESNESDLATEFDGRRPVHCLISDFDAGIFASDSYNDLFGAYDYAHPLLGSVNTPRWLNSQVKRFAYGDNSSRMPIAQQPVAAFTKKDLQFANRFSADLLGNSAEQVTEAKSVESDFITIGTAKFLSKDFLTTLQTSAFGSIMLPVNQTQQLARDYTAQLMAERANTSRTRASRKVASQLRTVGQFLVDFATQIENRVEQVEIARGQNKRLESKQR